MVIMTDKQALGSNLEAELLLLKCLRQEAEASPHGWVYGVFKRSSSASKLAGFKYLEAKPT